MFSPLKSAVKAMLESLRRRRSASALKHAAPHFKRAELTADLHKMGILPGDTVFIHASLKSLGYVEGGAAQVIGALQDAVGTHGTLLIPSYYMPGGSILGTCKLAGYVFDPRRHGTHMGRLPEAFLAGGAIERSLHPTHSVAAWGRHAAFLTHGHHLAPSVFGQGSPWQRLLEIEHAKVLGLGISMGPVTFYHLLEDSMGDAFPVPVWQSEIHHLPCRDGNGKIWQVPVRPFDMVIAERRIDHPPRSDLRAYFGAEFERAGLRVNGRVGNADSWWIPAQGFFQHLRKLAGENITIYSSAQQLAARPIKPER